MRGILSAFASMAIMSLAAKQAAMRPFLVSEPNLPVERGAMRRRSRGSKYRQHPRKMRAWAEPEFAAIVNKMTNRERNHWARAGYPGLKGHSAKKVAEFCPAAERRRTGAVLVL